MISKHNKFEIVDEITRHNKTHKVRKNECCPFCGGMVDIVGLGYSLDSNKQCHVGKCRNCHEELISYDGLNKKIGDDAWM